jgi:hypothetical protein
MSVSFTKESEDLFVVSVEGILTFNDLKEIQNNASTAIDRSRKIKVLLLAENFSGWAKEGDWGNLEFLLEHDPYIQKIAVVTSEEKKDDLLIFLGKGMREASVEFFPAGEEEKARDWLKRQAE